MLCAQKPAVRIFLYGASQRGGCRRHLGASQQGETHTMFRAISSRVGLFATTVESRKHQHRHYAHGHVISGHAASICIINAPKLNRSRPASWHLPGLDVQHNDVSLQMPIGFRARNPPHLSFQHIADNPGGSRRYGNLDGRGNYSTESFFSIISTKIGEVCNALATSKYDTLVLRKGGVVNVPQGRHVSEAEWESLETGRKVNFSPRIRVTLIPSKGECYPTPAHKAACFLSGHEIAQESRRISAGGGDSSEWAALLAETRQDAWKAREYNRQAQPQMYAQQQHQQEEEEQQHQERAQKKASKTSALNFFEILGSCLPKFYVV